MNRRDYIKKIGKGAGFVLTAPLVPKVILAEEPVVKPALSVLHSISRWCFNSITLEPLIEYCQATGIQSIELLEPEEYRLVVKKGLTCAVANSPASHITRGFNDPSMHEYLFKEYQRLIPMAADAGIPNIICFSGNRNGLSDEKGWENCAVGLEKVIQVAEKNNINLIMELLNSKVDHADYQCDHSDWGIHLVKKMGSHRFKLLYDIYHMQIMEGNVIETIQKNIQYLAHFHLAGVPGRHDLDEAQELNYKAIIRAIKDTGYNGFFGQEFIPKQKNPLDSLPAAIQLVEQS